MADVEGLPADATALLEDFDLFDDWEDRYAYLVDLGRRLPPLPDTMKTDAHKVSGCMSQVWFVREDRGDHRLHWRGDSDAAIVRGLIAVLQVLYEGRRFEEAEAIDVEGVFRSMGLERHLTINRRNGFYSMVSKLREFAAAEA
jgi:cysteine desulfuration protein SufE